MKLNWRERSIHYRPRIMNMLMAKAHCGRGRPHFSTILFVLSCSKNKYPLPMSILKADHILFNT